MTKLKKVLANIRKSNSSDSTGLWGNSDVWQGVGPSMSIRR